MSNKFQSSTFVIDAVSKKVSLGDTVKRLRLKQAVTLEELSRRSGMSKSNISRIENGKISPTYDALCQISIGLGIDTQELFRSNDANKPTGRRSLTRAGDEKIIETPHYRLSIFCSDVTSRHFTMFSAEIKARSINEFASLMRHEGEEQIFVMEGAIVVYSDIYEPCRLEVGESIFFDSSIGHAVISVSEPDAKVIWTCSSSERLSSKLPT
jgi:transcriptional regulator with XRE-family HTH domain